MHPAGQRGPGPWVYCSGNRWVKSSQPRHVPPAQDLDLMVRENHCEIMRKQPRKAKKLKMSKVESERYMMEAEVKTLPESRQSIQEGKKKLSPCGRTARKISFTPTGQLHLALKSFTFKGDNEIVPVTAPCINNIYFTLCPGDTISKNTS